MTTDNIELIANMQALVAVLFAASKRGLDVEGLCEDAKGYLVDSGNPCKWANAESVPPSQDAIDAALKIALRRE